MKPSTLLIRADAHVAIGTGHVMRCLALAQAWQDAGGQVVYAMASSTPAVLALLQKENVQVAQLGADSDLHADAAQTISVAQTLAAPWVVVDGYPFDAEYQVALKQSGLQVLLVDDLSRPVHYDADLILNQNLQAAEASYRDRESYTRLLLGPRYAMLRREFVRWQPPQRVIPPRASRVLVTMGGSDPDNFTLKVVQALQSIASDSLEVRIVAGGSNPHLAELERAIQSAPYSVRLITNARNMPELLAWADVAISGAGSTCWEMCFLGLPALIVDLASNQFPIAQRLHEFGAARRIGSSHDCAPEKVARELAGLLQSEEERRQMSLRGRELVDGKGASRVCAAMLGTGLQLRRATEADARMLWEWANEPGVRASAFAQQEISWEEHERWLQVRLRDPSSIVLIAEDALSRPVGQIRIDRQPNAEADIDVSVARDFRSAGYGTLLIDAGVRQAFSSTSIARVNAFIRPENRSSIRAFEKAGFHRIGDTVVKGHPAVHLCRQAEPRDTASSKKG